MRAQTKFPTNSGASNSGSIQMEQKRVLRIAKSPMFQAQAFEYEIGETGARIVKVSTERTNYIGRNGERVSVSLSSLSLSSFPPVCFN